MRRHCTRCNRELATGQAVCVCGWKQHDRTQISPVAFGRITALETATRELQQVTRTPKPKGRP